jgi:hypothetical protein
MLGQLITTIAPEQAVLRAIDDQLLVGPVRAPQRVGANLRPVNHDHPTTTKAASPHNANTLVNNYAIACVRRRGSAPREADPGSA